VAFAQQGLATGAEGMSMDKLREAARAEADRNWRAYRILGRECSPEAREILSQTSALMDDMAGVKREIHTIPVPDGWSVEQAWEAITRGDELTDPEPMWANVLLRDGEFAEVIDT
jgi:hypothetical protein